MKRKYLTNTYLRETIKYTLKLFLDEEDHYICAKKLVNVTEKFILSDGTIAMDNGYYILEIVPKEEHYALRIFFNNEKKVVEYYFDVIKQSGVDELYKIPYFDDLYLDIAISPDTNVFTILDEEELLEAYENGVIDKDDYDLAMTTMKKLLTEIKNKNNKLLKIDFSKYLDSL